MRQYPENGYRWLRTLESWNFGGILADDMGLGKTLQMIAVLLAAKLEGKTGTSLIVTPASLVFNWGEEFKKICPGIKGDAGGRHPGRASEKAGGIRSLGRAHHLL